MSNDLATWLRAEITRDLETARAEIGEGRRFGVRNTIARCEAELSILDLHVNGGGSLRDPRDDRITYDYKVDTCAECGPSTWPFGKLPIGTYGYLDVWEDEYGDPTLWPCLTVRRMAWGYRHRDGYPGSPTLPEPLERDRS